jgi:hypothetical protein
MKSFPKFRDYQRARRHALKLAFWPKAGAGDFGQMMDLDWEWIRSMKGADVGELRISDTIGGHDNLRIIFYVSGTILKDDPLPRIWALSILQKKSRDFTSRDLSTFRGRLTILKARYYSTN